MKHIHTEIANHWIRINNITPALKSLLKEYSGDHLLGYVYIDHTAGITLDIIKLFEVVEDEIIFQRSPVDDNTRAICRFSEFINAGEISILSDEFVNAHNLEYPSEVLAVYAKPQLEDFRAAEAFHAFRAEGFPDDIQVLLPPIGELKPELIWARVETYENNVVTCQLLNEPHQNFGLHVNSTITASLAAVGDDAYVVAHIELPKSTTQKQSTKNKKWWQFW